MSRGETSPIGRKFYPGATFEERVMRSKLTAAAVEQFEPCGDFPIEKPDAVVVGLRLVIQPSGHKSWAVRYRHEGRNKKLTLGPWPRIGLQKARELAAEELRQTAERA